MFHKKILSAVFAAAVFFTITISHTFAASRNITSLKLDFLRTEELLSDNQSSSLKGQIIYNKNPFVFIFKITEPVVQIMYINEKSAYLFDEDTIYEITEDSDFLSQTCTDFLNWFKEDYGLADSKFKPTNRWLEEQSIVSQWDCYEIEDQPLNKVLVYSDSAGRFTRLKMYTGEDKLVTDTSLQNFKSFQGFAHPTSVVSVSYEDEMPVLKTKLDFSNISFTLSSDELSEIQNFTEQSELILAEYPATDLSDLPKTITPSVPSQVSYKVSIPAVITGVSFKFYKKFITSQDMTNCPFYPSCSQYMLDAVSKNGVFGFFQGLERLRRCTSSEHRRNLYPTLSNGKHYDPVP